MARAGEKMQADVLAILRRRGGPVSAYEVLAELRRDNPKLAPTTIYRALSALGEMRKVHRLESLNAYMACKCDQHQHAAILSICGDCGSVEESVAPELLKRLTRIAGKSGFAPTRHVIEVHGTCASCGTGQAPA